jgi:hypothetical protein
METVGNSKLLPISTPLSELDAVLFRELFGPPEPDELMVCLKIEP